MMCWRIGITLKKRKNKVYSHWFVNEVILKSDNMKKIRNILAGILCLALLISIPVSVEAAATTFVRGYYVEGDTISVVCTDIAATDLTSPSGTFQLTAQGKNLAIESITTIGAETIPTTYYCLVDVSGSMRQEQMDQMKAILHRINESMQFGDNMIIASLGNQVTSSGYLESAEDRKSAIDALAAGNEDTNLYAGIAEGLKFLETDINVHQQKCLLVFSDGQDDQKSGITKEEAERAILESDVSIFTVATLRENPTDVQIEYGKLLGSFARLSVGGCHYAPVIDGTSQVDVGTDIVNTMQNAVLLVVNASELQANSGIISLKVTYTEGSTVLEDTVEIDAALLPVVEQEEQVSQDSPAEDSTAEVDLVNAEKPGDAKDVENQSTSESTAGQDAVLKESKFQLSEINTWMLVEVASGVLVLTIVITVVVLVCVKKKKGKKVASAGVAYGTVDDEAKTTMGNECEIHFVVAETGQLHKTLSVEEGKEIVIGRNQYADFKLNLEDKKISGTHCRIKYQSETIFVEDMDSTNGTFVNGRNIAGQGAVRVNSGDKVKIGHGVYILKY